MALSDRQVFELAKRMDVPLVFCDFKDNLRTKRGVALHLFPN